MIGIEEGPIATLLARVVIGGGGGGGWEFVVVVVGDGVGIADRGSASTEEGHGCDQIGQFDGGREWIQL